MSETHHIRRPTADDGVALHALIAACPPLDVNTPYCYHLLVRHFAATCLVAERGGELVAGVTGYRLPDESDVLFIWQIAVMSSERGHGLAGRLLDRLIAEQHAAGARRIHTTIGPDNVASRRAFERLAERLGAAHAYHSFLTGEQCGEGHEPEDLLEIGPLPESIPAIREATA